MTVRLIILFFSFCSMCRCIAQDKLYPNEFPLADVQLLKGPFRHARDLNIKVLLQYDVDRLLAGYRKEAGLPAKDSSFQNWHGLDGHVAGHYLSALAMNFAATKNKACGERMLYVLAELKACQQANALNHPQWGKGYLGAVPDGDKIWGHFKKGDFAAFKSAWVPFYNIHKMYAGLRDAWMYTGNEDARTMFLAFCDWGIGMIEDLSEAQLQSILDIEHGGMNEVFADAYQLTQNKKYLLAARRFSHHQLLDAMARGVDNLDNKHANTQVPKAIGFARIGELDNNGHYAKAGDFFWQTVTKNRTLAFGGNSRREFFPAVASCSDFIHDVEGPESCNTYNMLKLTEVLFRMGPSARYVDFYERALYNHILSTQHPGNGGYVYFTPARPNSYRVYSAPNQAMWCCVGSGMENHGKYNQFIYTHKKDSLFLNLFMASSLNWKEKGVRLRQETGFPYEEHTKLIITEGVSRFTLLIRYPSWVAGGAMKIMVNGRSFPINTQSSSYVAIDRAWKKGDVVHVSLPMHNSIEQLPNVPGYVAFLHGPIVLAAKTGTEDLKGLIASDSRWGHIPPGKRLPLDKAPILIKSNINPIANELVPVKNKPLHFTVANLKMENAIDVELQPFYQVHDSRYMLYWMALTNDQYRSYIDSLASMEKQKIDLQDRTVDFVAPGEQQPEADHAMQHKNSQTGNTFGQFWRDASNDGFFSYQLSTGNETNLLLQVRFWGAEWGNRKFEIYIDDEKLVTENNTGRWNRSEFFDMLYPLPASMLNGKKSVRLKFQPLPGNTAGAVYYIRLIRNTNH
jgi:uncharacterized protein